MKLLPQPKLVVMNRGHFRLPTTGTIGISDSRLAALASGLGDLLPGHARMAAVPGQRDTVALALDPGLNPGAYRLVIGAGGIRVTAQSGAAAFHAVQTLRQVAADSPAGRLPCLAIRDEPDFQNRGVYYDITRGRVPTLDAVMKQVDLLAHYKINHYQLYIEHVFRFRAHPDIGRNASPLTPDDILALDAFCRERHVELVPSLACFGHLATVLHLPQYRALAEDWGIGKYLSPEAEKLAGWQRHTAWSLSPANPESYKFLDALFREFLPLFSSGQFNVCCDETFDLGLGQSYALAKKIGKGRLYLNHLVKLRDLAGRYGKRIMFWGDIIRRHPELIGQLPRDVTVLDWGYGHNHPFDQIADFRKAGLPFYACPGTSSWCSLFPRLHEATGNIHGFAVAAKRHGAAGLLNTDWGDGGHYNFMEYSWHGYLFGAEQAWNTGADRTDFTRRFSARLFGIDDPAFARRVEELGDISHLSFSRYYQSLWQHVFFAPAGDPVFKIGQDAAWVCRGGRISHVKAFRLTRRLGRETQERLAAVRRAIEAQRATRGADPHGILPYWLFAVDTLLHAAGKLTVLGEDGENFAPARRELARGLRGLRRRFEDLWRQRNRPSEIRTTLARYRKVMRSLTKRRLKD